MRAARYVAAGVQALTAAAGSQEKDALPNKQRPAQASAQAGRRNLHCQGDRSKLRGCSAVAISHRNRSSVQPGHRSSARKPEHSRWAHSSSSCSSRDGGTDGNGDACTSAHSTRARHSTTVRAHSRWARPGHSTKVRGHNTKVRAHNNRRQTGGLPPARRKAQTGRRAEGPATRSGISSTELLNRYLRGCHIFHEPHGKLGPLAQYVAIYSGQAVTALRGPLSGIASLMVIVDPGDST